MRPYTLVMGKQLTISQHAALTWAKNHKGFVSTGGDAKSGVTQRTVDALVAMELLQFHASTGWRMGRGRRNQYKLTSAGLAVL